jgi:hypothetical protein
VGELTNSRASEIDGGFIRTTTDQAAQATRLSLCLIGVGQVLIDESPSPPLTIRNPQSAIRNSPVSVYRNGIPTIAQSVLLGTVGGSLIRGSLDRLTKIVRGNIRQAVWQSIALVISIFIATVGGLAYQTSALNKRFEQIEKRRKESDERFVARRELSAKNITARFEDLQQEVRAQRK